MTRYVMAGAIVGTVAMLLAMLGRAWDWSPFAMVLSGAVLGFAVGIALTVLVYESDDDPLGECRDPNPLYGTVRCRAEAGHVGDHVGDSASGFTLRWRRP